MKKIYIVLFITLLFSGVLDAQVVTGAERLQRYVPLLLRKNVALLANQTSVVDKTHLLDTLISVGVEVKKIFTPEHGFRGNADAGEKVLDGKDVRTGIPIISLYGKHKKPTKCDMEGIDIVVFDIQDVGVRFYTYISTLHYVMEACVENNVKLFVLDRPNPNAFYIDGPVLENEHKSFVGMHNVPVVYGMTIGEYAKFINGEYISKSVGECDLEIIELKRWNHQTRYKLPIKPSPNLPNYDSVLLYPSLCFFEGTVVSAGRGTKTPFQIFGAPNMTKTDFSFTPQSIEGACKYPKFQNMKCNGVNLMGKGSKIYRTKQLNLDYLIFAYENTPDKSVFFNTFFEKLAGTSVLRKQIIEGLTAEEISASWREDIEKFKMIRKKYLLYK